VVQLINEMAGFRSREFASRKVSCENVRVKFRGRSRRGKRGGKRAEKMDELSFE
jgi:hypothetical protein